MTLKLKLFAAATLLSCAPFIALAQATPAAASSPAKKELVNRILVQQQSGVDAVSRGMLQQPVSALMQNAGAALQQMPADKREAAAKAIEADIKKFVDETAPMLRERATKLAPSTVGTLLEERFSEDELRQIAAWLESPTFKKYGQMAGDMQRALSEKLLAETRPTVEPRLIALEQNVRKHLGIPAQAASKPAPAAKK